MKSIYLVLAAMALVAVAYGVALFTLDVTKGSSRAVAPYSNSNSLDNYMEDRLNASLRQ